MIQRRTFLRGLLAAAVAAVLDVGAALGAAKYTPQLAAEPWRFLSLEWTDLFRVFRGDELIYAGNEPPELPIGCLIKVVVNNPRSDVMRTLDVYPDVLDERLAAALAEPGYRPLGFDNVQVATGAVEFATLRATRV